MEDVIATSFRTITAPSASRPRNGFESWASKSDLNNTIAIGALWLGFAVVVGTAILGVASMVLPPSWRPL